MAESIQLFRPLICEEAVSAAADALRSGWIGLGPRTEAFENAFAQWLGAAHAVATSSATAALHIALAAHGIGSGDEVITTPITFVSTNHAIRYVGAEPVFCDVEPATMNLDLDRAAELVGPRTKALMAVHYGGNPIDLDRLCAFAAKHRILIIGDAAHACGTSFNGARVGATGTVCFSFHAVKNLPIGDGGMLVTDDPAVAARARRLRWMGIDRSTHARAGNHYAWEYDVPELGWKEHMNDIAAAIGLAQLPHVDGWNARRREIADAYLASIAQLDPELVQPVAVHRQAVSARHLCALQVKDRDAVADRLRLAGIGSGVHYKPNHFYEPYLSARRGSLAVAESAWRRLISLPLHMHLSDADVQRVCEVLPKAIAGS
jgi:perosamine synthetase